MFYYVKIKEFCSLKKPNLVYYILLTFINHLTLPFRAVDSVEQECSHFFFHCFIPSSYVYVSTW